MAFAQAESGFEMAGDALDIKAQGEGWGSADHATRRQQVQELRARILKLGAAAAKQSGNNAEYRTLMAIARDRREAHESAVRAAQERQNVTSSSSIKLLDPAAPPSRPSTDRSALYLAFGLLAGLCAGLVFALSGAWRDRALAANAEAGAALGVPVLGAAPQASRGETVLAKAATWNFRKPGSELAGDYRDIATSLFFNAGEHDGHLRIVVTSSKPGEGRTTAAANLAIALSETGWRILLIDANRRGAALHEVFGTSNLTGFFQAVYE